MRNVVFCVTVSLASISQGLLGQVGTGPKLRCNTAMLFTMSWSTFTLSSLNQPPILLERATVVSLESTPVRVVTQRQPSRPIA